jgi:FkbM family methyltransferase
VALTDAPESGPNTGMVAVKTLYQRALPASLRRRLGLAELPRVLRLASGPRSVHRLRHLALADGDRRPPVTIRVRPLDGAPIALRPGTSDLSALHDTFDGRYHLPPVELGDAPRILDLGANIGLTAADFAATHPAARIVAVEMDAANAKLARENTRRWEDRVEVLNRAVWSEPREITYVGSAGDEYGFHIPGADARPGEITHTVATITLDELVGQHGPVDFVKMDIEGAEQEVLSRNTTWTRDVRVIQVEVHGDYTTDDCVRDLEALGFTTIVDDHHFAAVHGVRGPVGG